MDNRIYELETLIARYATAYYTGTSEVSDEYFDMLTEELKSLDPDNKILHTTGWGFVPSVHKERVTHPYNLYVGSLDKYKDVKDLNTHYNGHKVRISAKLDGLSVVSYYKNGYRVLCLTRGDGTTGLNITEHMEKICPEGHFIPGFSGAIRGEVCISNTTWKNSKYYEESLKDPSINQRNIAAGLINRNTLEPNEAELLDYVVYKVLADENTEYHDIESIDKWLMFYQAIHQVDMLYYPDNLKEDLLQRCYEEFCRKYPCDGLVITGQEVTTKDNQVQYNEVAFKFQAESKVVTVTGVEWTASRTGRIVPVVLYEPVNLSGAIISRATGFNAQFIKDNNINNGAKIKITRSNEVIPYIMDVVEEAQSPALIDRCPHCNRPLIWKGVDLVCEAENETQMPYNALTVLAPVHGAGDHIYSGIVKTFELYSLDDLARFINNLHVLGPDKLTWHIADSGYLSGEHTLMIANKILTALLGTVNAVDLLVACSIPGISETIAKRIITGYPEIFEDSETAFNEDKLYAINGIGDSIVNSLNNFIERIHMFDLLFDTEIPVITEKPIEFKVAITGKLSVKRADFEAELKSYGYELKDIGKDTKFLITDNPNSSSSKNKYADEHGITKITEEEFRKQFMCN